MNLFHPRTFSSDWEVMVVDRMNRTVDTEKIMGFAGMLQTEFRLPIKVDWKTLEFPLGINTTFAQLHDRIVRLTDRAAAVLREDGLDLFPAAAHPVGRLFNAAHVHVGTITDEAAGLELENRLIPFLPVFVALAANAPCWHGVRGEYKSYRVRYEANECIRPNSRRDPHFDQPIWGLDAGVKLYVVPTLEVRVIDCASSRRLLAEMAVFVAAWVHRMGSIADAEPLTEIAYQDYLINRWTAARDGLQATFRWQGTLRPAVEILDEMLDACADELEVLDASRDELVLIDTMREKRVCQADFVLALAERYPDPQLFSLAYAHLTRHWEVFDEYLERAQPLEPRAAPDAETILQAHLQVVGEGTPLYRTREVMALPPVAADALLETLLARGRIAWEVTPERGIVLSRTGDAGQE